MSERCDHIVCAKFNMQVYCLSFEYYLYYILLIEYFVHPKITICLTYRWFKLEFLLSTKDVLKHAVHIYDDLIAIIKSVFIYDRLVLHGLAFISIK